LDKYFHGLSDHLFKSSTPKSQPSAKPSVKTTSHLDLSPTGRKSPTATTNSIVHLGIFPHKPNDHNHTDGPILKDNNGQTEISTNNPIQNRDVVFRASPMLPSEHLQTSALSLSTTTA
jgi:hypothetical protein